MAIALHGLVVLTRIPTRTRTTTLTDLGAIDATLTFSGETAKRWHTAAQAKEIERQLHELAWYSRHVGGIHVNSDEFDIDDGLYALLTVETASEVVPFGGATILRVNLTLRRLGGPGYVGANATRRVAGSGVLTSNAFSITSTPTLALPVGAVEQDLFVGQSRAGADGTIKVRFSTSAPWQYQLSGADYNAGECKVWDTKGDATPANWVRVWAPDHTFADPRHCVIDNSLVRFQPHASADGLHSVQVWQQASAAWVTIGTSDSVQLGAGGTGARIGLTVDEIGPHRASVTFTYSYTVAPFLFAKTIVIERGKRLAKVTLTPASEYGSVAMFLGLIGVGRWTVGPIGGTSTQAAGDETLTQEAGDVALSTPGENWLATWAAGTDILGVVAFAATSGYSFYKQNSGGIAVGLTATSLTVYIGGTYYDVTKAQGEAENGTLTGTAALTAAVDGAGTSGDGSSEAVTLPAANDSVQCNALSNPPTATRVRAWFRVQNVGTSASDSVQVLIRNVTAGSDQGATTNTFSALGSSGTWKWLTTEYSSWNGTDTIAPKAVRLAAGGGGTLYIDQMLFLAVDGGYEYARQLGIQAMTEMRAWAETARRVM